MNDNLPWQRFAVVWMRKHWWQQRRRIYYNHQSNHSRMGLCVRIRNNKEQNERCAMNPLKHETIHIASAEGKTFHLRWAYCGMCVIQSHSQSVRMWTRILQSIENSLDAKVGRQIFRYLSLSFSRPLSEIEKWNQIWCRGLILKMVRKTFAMWKMK